VTFTRGAIALVGACRSAVDWADTSVDLPPGQWTDLLTGAPVEAGRQPVAALLDPHAVAVLARGEA
jgi:maltooligosyltrehalose synthase